MRGRLTFVTALTVLAVACAVAFGLPRLQSDTAFAGMVVKNGEVREYGYGLIRFNGWGPERHRWERILEKRQLEAKLVRANERVRELTGQLRRKWAPQALQMSKIACAAYRQSGPCDPNLIYRQIDCETGGTFSPWAKNRTSTASGWGQFLDSTWAGTLFAGFSVFDPMANVLAMAKAHATGSGESTRGPWAASAGCWS